MKNVIKAVNIFDENNEQLRNCFLFFFFTAVCAYLSLIVSSDPYRDDAARYIGNWPVGVAVSARYLTLLSELIIYLSRVITDYAPFSHILSCFFFAYGTILCLKIFNVDINNKWKVASFSIMFANPYMLENMMYRFDNPFMSLPMLMVITAAYLTFNNKYFWVQVSLLIGSLFIYQPAISFYCIIILYLTILKIRNGIKIAAAIVKMRYWIVSVFSVSICYLPFTKLINYVRSDDGNLFIIPNKIENICVIIQRIECYLSSIYQDWFNTIVGQFFLMLIVIFILNTLLQTFTKTKSLMSVMFMLIAIFLMFLCPYAVNISIKRDITIFPRIMYSFGLIFALILYDNYDLFSKLKSTKIFYNFLVSSLVLWNLVFLNSAGNIKHQINIAQQHIFYDLSKDIDKIICRNKNISRVFIDSHRCLHQTISNFAKKYPFLERIMYDPWNNPDYCRIASMNYKFASLRANSKHMNLPFHDSEYKTKSLIKSHMCYDIFILDNKLMLISFKGIQTKDRLKKYALIREENEKEKGDTLNVK